MRRRGVAPLEFVFALPLLLCLAALIASWFFVMLARSQAAVEARHSVWSRRGETAMQERLSIGYDFRTSETRPLAAAQFFQPRSGEIFGVTGSTVSIAPWLRGARSGVPVKSGNAIVTGVWDFRQQPIEGSGPHLDVAGRMVDVRTADFGRMLKFP